MRTLVFSTLLMLWAGCVKVDDAFTCTDSSQCKLSGVVGVCEPDTHRCSLPDTSCPSKKRYTIYSEAALSEQCVPLSCGGAGQSCCTTGGTACKVPTLSCVSGACTACISQVSVRGAHSCVRTTGGAAWCWGENADGQLGAGDVAPKDRPVEVLEASRAALTEVAEVAAADFHTCVRKAGGTVWCWGRNDLGQLGNGATGASLTPVQVTTASGALTGVVRIASGINFTCAVKGDTVYCWGDNADGQLGDGSTSASGLAVQVQTSATGGPFSGVVELTAGAGHACARKNDGTLWCWGANASGQLGNGTTDRAPWPTQVLESQAGATFANIAQVAAGEDHTCARKNNGPVFCWGEDKFGQLGDGSTSNNSIPLQVVTAVGAEPFSGSTFIVTGEDGTCAIKGDRSLWCWGNNGNAQLGDGTVAQRTTPVLALGPDGSPLTDAVQAGMGEVHSCALKVDGSVWCWGLNELTQLGQPPATLGNSTVPVQVPLSCN